MGIADDMCAQIFECSPVNGRVKVYGVKSTGITTEIDLLAQLAGEVRMIVMVRDPRDVLASNIRRVGDDRTLDGYAVISSLCK